MAAYNLVMPKMGESIMEATILKWVKSVGDRVEIDDTILEIATDKVDSEIPSPVSGILTEILFQEDDVVEIGKVIAVIQTEVEVEEPMVSTSPAGGKSTGHQVPGGEEAKGLTDTEPALTTLEQPFPSSSGTGGREEDKRFYSPLVRNIARKENISPEELAMVPGTGQNGRLTKKDLISYLQNRPAVGIKSTSTKAPARELQRNPSPQSQPALRESTPIQSSNGQHEIIEMDRMRKLIAEHMVRSKHTSPHVTSFIEVDVTDIVKWRERIKLGFQEKYGEKFTFTPIFIEAVVRAIRDFPMVNISLDGTSIIKKKSINIGMATALPNGNLIVPVIKHADRLNLLGIAQAVNDLANRARHNKLAPEEIKDGTFTLTNVGTFGNVMGTPIINQPQVAILAVGAIRKKPAVVETEYGDLIAVRHMMFLSLSYDHRIVDGFLGGSFLRRIGDYLEQFDHTITL